MTKRHEPMKIDGMAVVPGEVEGYLKGPDGRLYRVPEWNGSTFLFIDTEDPSDQGVWRITDTGTWERYAHIT